MRRLPEAPFRAALLLPRWLGDAVMASALIEPLRRLSGRPVEIWAPEFLAPIFRPGEAISGFRVYEGRGRHRGLVGARRFRREGATPRADAVWVVPDSLSSALTARFSGVPRRIGRAREGRSPLLGPALHGLRRDRKRHWIDEKADLLRPFMDESELPTLIPRLSLDDNDAAFAKWLKGEGLSPESFDILAPGAAYGPAKRWWGFADYAQAMDPSRKLLLVGSRGEKKELESLAAELKSKGRTAALHAGDLDLARLARLCRAARRVLSNDSGALHLAAAAGAEVTGIFLSTDPAWTAPRGTRSRWVASRVPCNPCFKRSCPLDEMLCQQDVLPELRTLFDSSGERGNP